MPMDKERGCEKLFTCFEKETTSTQSENTAIPPSSRLSVRDHPANQGGFSK
jgi:hypothetical protein